MKISGPVVNKKDGRVNMKGGDPLSEFFVLVAVLIAIASLLKKLI